MPAPATTANLLTRTVILILTPAPRQVTQSIKAARAQREAKAKDEEAKQAEAQALQARRFVTQME